MQNTNFTNKDITDTLDRVAKRYIKIEGFIYIAQIKDSTEDSDTGSYFEISHDEKFHKVLPKNVELLVKGEPSGLFIDVVVIKTKKKINYFRNSSSNLCQKVPNSFPQKKILGGGAVKLKKDLPGRRVNTMACFLKDKDCGDLYALTAKHAVVDSFKRNPIYFSNNGRNYRKIGEVSHFEKGKKIDFALCKIYKRHEKNIKSGVLLYETVYDPFLEVNDIYLMRKYGYRTKGTKDGKIISTHVRHCRNTEVITFLIKSKNGNCVFSNGGDSGSLIIDKDNHPIGIITDDFSGRTVCISMETIFEFIPKKLRDKLIFNYN